MHILDSTPDLSEQLSGTPTECALADRLSFDRLKTLIDQFTVLALTCPREVQTRAIVNWMVSTEDEGDMRIIPCLTLLTRFQRQCCGLFYTVGDGRRARLFEESVSSDLEYLQITAAEKAIARERGIPEADLKKLILLRNSESLDLSFAAIDLEKEAVSTDLKTRVRAVSRIKGVGVVFLDPPRRALPSIPELGSAPAPIFACAAPEIKGGACAASS